MSEIENNNRAERERLLLNTDWWGTSDNTMTQAQKDYRQALRDLPATEADPENATFPTKPS